MFVIPNSMIKSKVGGTPTIEIDAIDIEETYTNSAGKENVRKGTVTSRYNPKIKNCFVHIAIGGGHLNVSEEMLPILVEALGEIDLTPPSNKKEKTSKTSPKSQNEDDKLDRILEAVGQLGKAQSKLSKRISKLEG